MLQQKTCQAAFQDLSAPSVQGEISTYLGGRFIFPSLFNPLLLLSSLFFSWLFLPLPLFLPCDLSCLSRCPFPNFSAGFQWLRDHTSALSLPRSTLDNFCLGLEKLLACLFSTSGCLDSTFCLEISPCQAGSFRQMCESTSGSTGGKTKAPRREIDGQRLHTKPWADPAVNVETTLWMVPPGEKQSTEKLVCPGKEMAPETTLHLPASGYT